MGLEIGGLLGLIVIILAIWAIISTITSRAGLGIKIMWVLLIILLPGLGFILWLLLGPKRGHR